MLILRDTDGTPLTLASAKRDEWHRHVDCADEQDVRSRQAGPPVIRFFLVGWLVLQFLLSRLLGMPDHMYSPLIFLGATLGLLLWLIHWRLRLRRLPRVPGPVSDPENRLRKELVLHSAWLLTLLFLAGLLGVLFDRMQLASVTLPWGWFALLPLLLVVPLVQLPRLRRVQRRMIERAVSGSPTADTED